MRLTRAPSRSVSPKRTPEPSVAAPEADPWVPRRQPPASSSPPIAAAGAAVVLDRDRQRPQRRPGAGSRRAPLALRLGAEQPVLERRLRRGEAGDELARGRVGAARPQAKTSKPPSRCRRPSRCSIPSCSACHQVPRTWVMPVPGRRGPAPAGEAGAGDGRLAVAGEALQVGAVEGVGAGGRHAAGVGAELGAAGGVGPVGVGADVPAALGDRVLPGPSPRRAASSSSATASAIPIATIRPIPPRVPDIRPPSLVCVWGPRARAAQSLPPADGCQPVPRPARFARMAAMALPTKDQITEKLRAVIDPELRRSIVELGMVRSIEIQRRRPRRGGRLADHRRLPDPLPLRTGGRPAGLRAGRRDRGRRRLRRPLRRGERRPAADARPRQAAAGRAGQGQERDLRLLRQGRRRQVDDDRQPGRGADRRRPRRRRPRLRRLRLLDPAHARRQQQARGQRRAQDPAAGGGRRRQGDVDRLLRRGERRRRLARPDAAQGDPAVPRGRRLGRARVPAARPAAGDRRRLDDARPAAAAGQVRDRHHAAAGGPDRSPAAAPRWRPSSTSRSSA